MEKSREELVDTLIDDCHAKYDIEYYGFLANHTIHGLIALYGLEEKNDLIQKWYEEYVGHDYSGHFMEPPRPIDPSVQINSENFDSFIGAKKNFQELFLFFQNEMKTNPLPFLVRKYFLQLKNGLAGAAFHGLIHLGWAIYYARSQTALAEGFAYLTYANSPLPFPHHPKWVEEEEVENERINEETIEKLFSFFTKLANDDRLAELAKTSYFKENNLGFLDRIRKIASEFNEKIFEEYSLRVPAFSFFELLIAACKLFYETGSNDFFLLHLLTALFGVYHVLKEAPFEGKEARWVLWNFFHLSILTYIAQGMPPFIPQYSTSNLADMTPELRSWDEIIPQYLTNVPVRNEHTLKIVFVLKEFDRWIKDKKYSSFFKHIVIQTCADYKLYVYSGNGHYSSIKYTTPSTR